MLLGTLPPVSNRASWSDQLILKDAETGEPFDVSTAAEVRLEVGDECGARLVATLTGGTITIPTSNVIQWSFTRNQMQGLCAPKTYDVGITLTKADGTEQLLIGNLPVMDGHITYGY